MRPNILLFSALAALAAPESAVAAAGRRRRLGLGKWKDGPPSQIDCSLASHDYEYYWEKCWPGDALTMWWINGRCIGGNKQEVSELHRCHNPDGSRPHCHDCHDGRGNAFNVCGADNPNRDEVCEIAGSGNPKDCGDQGITAYTHQCNSESGGSDSWYVRESFQCSDEEMDMAGPNGEDPDESYFTCGEQWYYAYEDDDSGMAKLFPELAGMTQPFSTPKNEFCLDCGLAIGVCVGDADVTCEGLGLPGRGEEFDTTIAPYAAPRAEFTDPPALAALGTTTTPAPTEVDDDDEPSSDFEEEPSPDSQEGVAEGEGEVAGAAAPAPSSASLPSNSFIVAGSVIMGIVSVTLGI